MRSGYLDLYQLGRSASICGQAATPGVGLVEAPEGCHTVGSSMSHAQTGNRLFHKAVRLQLCTDSWLSPPITDCYSHVKNASLAAGRPEKRGCGWREREIKRRQRCN